MSKNIVAAATLAIALTGCSASVSSKPVVTPTVTQKVTETLTQTQTVTAAPLPAKTVTIEAPAPEPEVADESSDEMLEQLLEMTWNDSSKSEQKDMCWGYNFDKDLMWQSFMSGFEQEAAGFTVDRKKWEKFFDKKC